MMDDQAHIRFHEDADIESAIAIIARRELAGENALDGFIAKVGDIVQAQTLTPEEYQ